MPKNKKKLTDHPEKNAITSSDIPQQEATKTHINYRSKPATSPIHKIHSRQPLPPIPKGKEISDDCPSPPTKID